MFVLVEDAAKSIAWSDAEPGYLVWIGDRRGQWVQWSGVGDALMRSMAVVEVFEFVQRAQEVLLVPDQGSVQQFVAAGANPAFHDRIHAGYLDAAEHDLDTRVGEHSAEQLRKRTVAVADQVFGFGPGVLKVHDEMLRRRCHPRGGRMRGGAQDPDPAAGELDDREHGHPRPAQRDRFAQNASQQGGRL